MSAAELAAIWRIPIGTIRRWASEDNWPRIQGHPVLYDGVKAEESYAARRSGRDEVLSNVKLHRRRVAERRWRSEQDRS